MIEDFASQLLKDVLLELKPVAVKQGAIALPALLGITVVVQFLKLVIGNHPKRPANLWRFLSLGVGIAWVGVAGILSPPGGHFRPHMGWVIRSVFVGGFFGMLDVLAYQFLLDPWLKRWKAKREARRAARHHGRSP